MSKEYIDKSDIISNLEELNVISFYELNEHSKETYNEIKEMIQNMNGQDLRLHGECNQCQYYESVHGVQGHAPCSFWRIGSVLWNDYCSRYKKEGEVNE